MVSASRSDEEWRKSVTAALIAGAPVLTIDNVEDELRSPSLAMALTTSTWSDRILGKSQTITLPQRCTWIATGNNIRLGGDLPRRSYWIRMDAKTAQPWRTRTFKYRDLIARVQEQRGQLLAAVVTIYRCWVQRGRPLPDPVPRMAGFDNWVRLMAGLTAVMGYPSFLGNLDTMYAEADQEAPQWEAFLEWVDETWPEPFKTQEVGLRLEGDPDLWDIIPDELGPPTKPDFSTLLGRAFRKKAGYRLPSGLWIEKAGSRQRANLWTIEGGR